MPEMGNRKQAILGIDVMHNVVARLKRPPIFSVSNMCDNYNKAS